MDLQLAGKSAIITGGSGPIGRATAAVLAQEGVRVALVSRTLEALNAAVNEAIAASGGGHVIALPGDVTDDASVNHMVDAAAQQLGGVDILVYSAAPSVRSGGGGTEQFLNEAQFLAELDVKVLGLVRAARAVAPLMAAKGWGRIIPLAGTNLRNATAAAGSMRNASVVALSKNLADELGPKGINVTPVNPGVVKTFKTPDRAQRMGMTLDAFEESVGRETAIGRMVTAEEVAWVIAFLCSPKAVSISGDMVTVSGGAGKAIYY